MLSLVNSSDPSSSSSKVSGFTADERDSDHLPLQEDDPVVRFGEDRTSNFSIRGHVFALRNKSIGKSWPFASQLLQLCLKHGIRDLLPPFELPNSVRAHCFIRSVSEAEKVFVSSSHPEETALLLHGDPNSTRIDQIDLLKCSDEAQVRCLCEQDNGSSVTNHCDIEITIGEPVLILNPGAEETTSATASAASDIMASKVCPVCKAFSSTSNTTLNAHMDQCLSMESDAAPAADKMPRNLKVRPRKKRLMVDIYATAPSCTLEDLDRRNGSTWASVNAAAAASAEANSNSPAPKKPKLSQLEPGDERETEGAVYVDSNGIKLRILSKLNDASQVLSREEFTLRRNIKGVQDGKIILIKKKKHFASACSKKMKLKMKNKKLSSLKLFTFEAQAGAKVDHHHHEESHLEEEGSPVQLSGEAPDQSLSCGSANLKNWPSSKRSDLLKKVGKKDLHKILDRFKQDSRMGTMERRKPASDTPSASKSHFGELSQLLESKAAGLPSNTVQSQEIQENSSSRWPSGGTSANVLLKPVSSPRNTSEEFYMGRRRKSHGYTKTSKISADQTYRVPLKTKRAPALSGSNSGTIKLRKHRSLLAWTDRRMGEFSSDSNPRQHSSVEAIVSGQDEEVTNQSLHPGGDQCQDTQTIISELQVDPSVDMDALEDADASCIMPDPLVSQDQDFQLDINDKANPATPIQENEMPMAQVILLDKQDKAAPDILENGLVESQAKAASAQESSACLTSHGDLRIDIPIENSTIALVSPNQETKLVICREASASPASSASTISPASLYDYHSKASVLSTTQGKVSFPLPFMVANEGTRGIDIERNQPVELDSTVKKSQQPSDYHPCCCSWQSIMAGNMPPAKQKPLPSLHIRPSLSSFYAYSSLRTDAANTQSLESPTESILTRACSDVGSTSPSSGTPTPSSSNSILRLMGKDLMVVHNEESGQLPKLHSPATNNNSNVQTLPSPPGFASYARVSNHDAFSFASRSPSMTGLPAFHQRNMNLKPYTTNEVIIIDDSDDVFAPRGSASSHVPVSHTMFHERPFSYFPLHSHLLPKDNGIRLSNPANQGSSVLTAPHLPRPPFVFQSPSATHLNSSFYYPQSLR